MLMIRTVSNSVEVVNVGKSNVTNNARERRGDSTRNVRRVEKNEKRSGRGDDRRSGNDKKSSDNNKK